MKKIRLNSESYFQTGYPCHITIRSKKNETIYHNHKFTINCMDILESISLDYTMRLFVYCFMPDHIHMIICVEGKRSIIAFIQAFKSKATLESYNHGFQRKIFQARFYDGFIRSEQSLIDEIKYIMENPVRRGLVDDYRKYPYSKCFYDIEDGV